MISRLAALAAGTVLAVLGTGQAVATPPAHATAPGCAAPSPAEPNGKQWPAEPAMAIDPGYPYAARLQTNCGEVTVDLDAAHAPHTVNSFAFLAGEQFFDHTRCHRLTTAGLYVLQCGDPTATGTGGPGYSFADENLDGATYPAGTVAMANSGPDTNGSQFFLVYDDSPLPPNYTPFGHVSGGLDVLRTIAADGTADGSDDGAPATEVAIESATAGQR